MIRLKNRFGKANRKEMSWMSDLMETLRQEGISPDLLRAVEEYRAAHALPEALRPRHPRFRLYLLRPGGLGAGTGGPALRRELLLARRPRPPAKMCWPRIWPPLLAAPHGTSRSM